MKSTMQLAFAAVGSLLLGSSAMGQWTDEFQTVEVRSFTNFFLNHHPDASVRDAYADAGVRTYRVYAVFNAAARVTSHGGDPNNSFVSAFMSSGPLWNFTQDSGGEEIHYNLAPTDTDIALNPSHAFDTFITIGTHQDPGFAFFYNSPEAFAAETNNMQGAWTAESSGVMMFPISDQGVASQTQQGLENDGLYRVLLYQYSIRETDSQLMFGDIGRLVGTDSNGQFFSFAGAEYKWIPAPAGLALLGMAGLLVSRRRSRALR